MTWIVTGVAVAGTLYSGYSQSKAAQAGAAESRIQSFGAIKEGAMNHEFALMEAEDIRIAGRDQADMVKRAAMLERAKITVAQSGSGVVIGDGSAQAALNQLDALSSADALAALYSSVNSAAATRARGRLNLEAGNQRSSALLREANSQETAGRAAVTGSLLTATSQAVGGYAKSQK